MNHPHNPQVDRIFARWNKPDSPGFALAVSKADKIIYSRGYGMADLDHNIPITPATVFHAASLTKQFTAMCVMLLVGQGRLSLTDEVHKLIPELKHVGPRITIADMLHHISGIRDQWVLVTMAGWRLSDDVVTRNDVLDLVKRMKTLNFRPGSAYSYSNTNYTLAGLIVEQVSGLLLSEFARQNIFVPLKMTSTAVADTHGLIVENRAYGYRATGHASFETRMPNYDLTGPTGLLTTVEDLMLWNHNFDSKVVGGKAALAAMQKPVANSNGYGLGLFISKEKGRRIVEHNGRDAGYRSHLIRFPGQKLAIALLGNVLLENIETDDLVRAVAAVYLKHKSVAAPQDAAEAPPETTGGTSAHPLKPADAAEYLGRYYSEEIDTIYQIVLKGSSLQIVRKKYDPTPLYPLARDKFTMDDNFSNVLTTGALHFGRDARRKINGFRIDDTTPGSGNRLANFRFSKLPPK